MSVYTKEQNDWNFQKNIVESFWNRVRNNEIEAELNTLGLDKKDAILEIGCGVGIVGRYLINKNFNYWGCEPSVIPYTLIDKNRFKKKYHYELSEELRKKIKTIILADVIEHIENDKNFLEDVINSFSSVENILITVPAYNILWNENDRHVGHFRRYSVKGLVNLIKDLNLEKNEVCIENIRHLFFLLGILMSLSNIKNLLFRQKPKLNVIRNGSRIDYFLEKVSNIESKLKLPFGSSILMTLKINN